MYNLSCCMLSYLISTNIQAFSKTFMLTFCHSELVKVLMEGQIHTFFRSVMFVILFHVKMLLQFILPKNSFIG